MNLCIYRPDYNILTHLHEHFIPKQLIFFTDTVLSMIQPQYVACGGKKIHPSENSYDFILWTFDK